MTEKACVKRLQKEYRALCKEPVSNVVARPLPNDILEWHYVLEGSQGTPFAGFWFFYLVTLSIFGLRILARKWVVQLCVFLHMCGCAFNLLRSFCFYTDDDSHFIFLLPLLIVQGGYYYGKIKFPPEYPFKPPAISMTTPNGRFMTQKKICLSMSDFHPETWNPMWSVSSILNGLLSFMMDNSPTTGSVVTTDEEKQRLAKTSLAFNCKNPTFRKLFPEYMEKYEEMLASEQSANKAAQESTPDENSGPVLKKRGGGAKEEPGNVEVPKELNKQRRQQSIPTWLLFLLVFIFAAVMALPLLHL